MTSNLPIRAGLLAGGTSGRLFHAPFLAAHPGFELAAVVERHGPTLSAQYPGLRSHGSVTELLADNSLELIVVNTPNDTHFDLTAQALAAGRHVLLEKPVVPTPAEWRTLLALAQARGRQVLPYQNRRWDSDFGAVRRVVESGQLGRLVEAHFRFDRYRPALSAKTFKETPRLGAGLLYDLGPHLLDQAISLFGKPLSWVKTLAAHRPGSLVDDFFSLHLRFAAELNVWLTASQLVADPGPGYVLHGTHGSYRKPRADPQEAQLLAGLPPLDLAYGRENPAHAGRLTLADPATPGQLLPVSADAAAPASYWGLFEAVYQTIRHGQPYPVRGEQIEWQLEVLAGG